MSHVPSTHPRPLSRPRIAQCVGRTRSVLCLQPNPDPKPHRAARRPTQTSTPPLPSISAAFPSDLPACPLLWGQAAVRYFPL